MMSKQQDNREVGFRHYMRDHYPSIEIITLEMPFEATRAEYDELLENFSHNTHTSTNASHWAQEPTSWAISC